MRRVQGYRSVLGETFHELTKNSPEAPHPSDYVAASISMSGIVVWRPCNRNAGDEERDRHGGGSDFLAGHRRNRDRPRLPEVSGSGPPSRDVADRLREGRAAAAGTHLGPARQSRATSSLHRG